MRYRVVAVGRMKDAALRAACDGYLARLRRYARVEEREVKDEARVLEAMSEGSRLVALSGAGEQWTSEELAEWMPKTLTAGLAPQPPTALKRLTPDARGWQLVGGKLSEVKPPAMK